MGARVVPVAAAQAAHLAHAARSVRHGIRERSSAAFGGRFAGYSGGDHAVGAELNRRHPGQLSEGQLRTLQRRVRQWWALHRPDKEVFFPQKHSPGREAFYDFTNCDELGVTISGTPFDHLLFRAGAQLQQLALADGGVEREFRGAATWRAGGALAAGRRGGSVMFGQSLDGNP
jgi:hypothetical protein